MIPNDRPEGAHIDEHEFKKTKRFKKLVLVNGFHEQAELRVFIGQGSAMEIQVRPRNPNSKGYKITDEQ